MYDISHPLGSTVGDIEFYTTALAGTRGRILEPACGTGRVLIALLEAGYAADGLDCSPDMVEICRKHCHERNLDPELFVGDMATFTRPATYEAVILPRGSIRNVPGRDATLGALRSFRDSLVPGGLLLLDVTIPLFVSGPLPIVEQWTRNPFVYTCETLVIAYDPLHDRTTRYSRYAKWDDGALVAMELHRFCYEHWSLPDFRTLLAEAGYVDITVTGDFTGEPPDESTRYWNFRARKPEDRPIR
ncbi:class I SAM-dependent methyltransferase [Actinomycetes bacterium KLBMP 9797]